MHEVNWDVKKKDTKKDKKLAKKGEEKRGDLHQIRWEKVILET
jgi:hypothetical protein